MMIFLKKQGEKMKKRLTFIISLFVFSSVFFWTAVSAQTGDAYAVRRKNLIEKIGKGLAVLPSKVSGARGPVDRGPQDNKDFDYLTGIAEPEAVLVLSGEGEQKEVLFNRSGKWTGPVGTTLDVRPASELRPFMIRSAAQKRIYIVFSTLDATFQAIGGAAVLAQSAEITNLEPVISEIRDIKSLGEIKTLQKAIDVTADAYVEVLKAIGPGMREIDLKAVLEYDYIRRGADASFTQIASGPNSVNIHFGVTQREMKAGDVIVFDLGAWYDKYTSDISRTVPVSGRFTKDQADIYNVVLNAQKEGIRLMVSGNGALKTQTAVEDALLAGLAKLGLVTDLASPWQKRLYIQHGFTHGIGLDVHDVWPWFSAEMRKGATYKPGMVYTMEPGLYFSEGMLDALPARLKSLVSEEEFKAFAAKVAPTYKKYSGMGCRIEDDILVTETGNQVLTARAPKEIADIEKTMKLSSPFKQMR